MLFVSFRPYQWIKNILLFGGLVFSRLLAQPEAVLLSIGAFINFCLASSSIYLLNDLFDIEKDRLHPVKCNRPLASGMLNKGLAVWVMIFMLLFSIFSAYLLNRSFAIVLLLYILLNLIYSIKLKIIAILDVICVAMGFVLRAIAGALVISVDVSQWLFLCTMMLALLVSFGKRRHEIFLLNTNAGEHRTSLNHYSESFLDTMMSISGAAALITYSLYTMADDTVIRFQSRWLILTIPFVIYGVFRYFYLVQNNIKGGGGDPAKLFIHDFPLIFNGFLWMAMIIIIIYSNEILEILL